MYYNYAVHGVITGNLDMISGDIPGAASRYVEESLGDDAVALWTSGAAGDQNPIYFNQTYELRDIRIADYAKRGEDISNAMPPGGQGMDRSNPTVQVLMDQQKQMNAIDGPDAGRGSAARDARGAGEAPAGTSPCAGPRPVLPVRRGSAPIRAGRLRGQVRRCGRGLPSASARCASATSTWARSMPRSTTASPSD